MAWGPKGVLAGPGTPRDPKSDVFVTKWVAIQPFGTFYARLDAEFRPGARQIRPTPSISTFCSTHFGPKNLEKSKFSICFRFFLSQAALEGLKVRFWDRFSVFFIVAGRLGGLPTPPQPKKVVFLPGVRVFFSVEGRLGGLRLKKSDF